MNNKTAKATDEEIAKAAILINKIEDWANGGRVYLFTEYDASTIMGLLRDKQFLRAALIKADAD